MANANEIRHHITAIEQTRKITGAMEMVSSNRMRRVMSHIEYNHLYYDHLRMVMREILDSADGISHPYLIQRPERRRTYIIIAGEKGLCGAYNSSLLALADECLDKNPGSSIITIGNTADDHFTRAGRIPDVSMFGISQDPTMKSARAVSRVAMKLYDECTTDEIHVVYTSFYGETKGKPVERRILPVIIEDYDDVELETLHREVVYHSSKKDVIDQLVPQYILGLLFGVMVQAYAGEHYARMNAMHLSTQNAGDMLKSLTTQYNMARQSAITNELAEITGAVEILKGGSQHA